MSSTLDSCEEVQAWAWKGLLRCVRVRRESADRKTLTLGWERTLRWQKNTQRYAWGVIYVCMEVCVCVCQSTHVRVVCAGVWGFACPCLRKTAKNEQYRLASVSTGCNIDVGHLFLERLNVQELNPPSCPVPNVFLTEKLWGEAVFKEVDH